MSFRASLWVFSGWFGSFIGNVDGLCVAWLVRGWFGGLQLTFSEYMS